MQIETIMLRSSDAEVDEMNVYGFRDGWGWEEEDGVQAKIASAKHDVRGRLGDGVVGAKETIIQVTHVE
jgi:hypothetical protein